MGEQGSSTKEIKMETQKNYISVMATENIY